MFDNLQSKQFEQTSSFLMVTMIYSQWNLATIVTLIWLIFVKFYYQIYSYYFWWTWFHLKIDTIMASVKVVIYCTKITGTFRLAKYCAWCYKIGFYCQHQFLNLWTAFRHPLTIGSYCSLLFSSGSNILSTRRKCNNSLFEFQTPRKSFII